MKPILSENEKMRLEQQIAEAEKRTHAQFVLSTAKRCDSYPDIPWKAFALGSSVAGLLTFAGAWIRPEWITASVVLQSVAVTLASGLILTGLTLVYPGFARLFLSRIRREAETRQYAQSLFLSRELFMTQKRMGILLLVSHFEKHVIILPDVGLQNRLDPASLKEIISNMAFLLRKGQTAEALGTGLNSLVILLEQKSPAEPGKNELPNQIIEEEGI
jgi:putative membrane protein